MAKLSPKNEKSQTIIKAFHNPIRHQIIELLRIYGNLSTKELSEKLNVSKQTILRHIDDLVTLKLIKIIEDDSFSTPYPKRYYKLITENFSYSVKGQNLAKDKNLTMAKVKQFNEYRLASYLDIQQLINAMVRYQERLNEASEKKDLKNAINVLRDNLGSLSKKYMTKKELAKLYKMDDSNYENDNKEFLKIELILPIKRVLEMDRKEEWEVDGNVWF